MKNKNTIPAIGKWFMPTSTALTILLAEDDPDDCLLFKDALDELQLNTELTTVENGEQLMQLLKGQAPMPDLLFMGINMPLKNGLECLSEIRQNKQLDQLPVIIISTSFEKNKTGLLYQNGAQHFIRKPNDFSELKTLINKALLLTLQAHPASFPSDKDQPTEDHFLIT